MKVREIIEELEDRGAMKTRTKGAHRRFESECGKCHTTVSGKPGDDMPKGTAKAIQRDMEDCYGKGWLGV